MGMIGSLGDVVFEVSTDKVRTFDDFSRSGSARWATHDIIGQKPLTEFSGPGQEEISFSMHLSAGLGINPSVELQKLRTMRDTGKVVPLIIGTAPISSSYWGIENLDEKHSTYDNKGRLIVAQVDVKLREYPRQQAKKSEVKKQMATKKDASGQKKPIGKIKLIAGDVNIRGGPSLKAKVIRVAKSGVELVVYGTKKTDITWYCLGGSHYITANTGYVKFKKE